MEKKFIVFTIPEPGSPQPTKITMAAEEHSIELANKMADDLLQQVGIRPSGFHYTTRARGEEDLDSKEISKSPMYYFEGKTLTMDQVKELPEPKRTNMIYNMGAAKCDTVVVMEIKQEIGFPLKPGDVVLKEV